MFLVFICLNKTKKDKFEFPFAFSIFDPGVDHLKNSAPSNQNSVVIVCRTIKKMSGFYVWFLFKQEAESA